MSTPMIMRVEDDNPFGTQRHGSLPGLPSLTKDKKKSKTDREGSMS